jgi:long-chain acyl-CoA synthetase
VLNFLRCAVGCVFVEGYGQTECTAGCMSISIIHPCDTLSSDQISLFVCEEIANVTLPGDAEGAHVGPPLPCTEIKLFSVPDMGYDAKEDKGEVCYRGTNIFKGYLNAPERTREAIDDDGWLHSGDIGQWLPNGTYQLFADLFLFHCVVDDTYNWCLLL